MKTSDLLEEGGRDKRALRKKAGDVLISVNKLHGDLIQAKSSGVEVPSKLEDMLYGLTAELDKFIGEN